MRIGEVENDLEKKRSSRGGTPIFGRGTLMLSGIIVWERCTYGWGTQLPKSTLDWREACLVEGTLLCQRGCKHSSSRKSKQGGVKLHSSRHNKEGCKSKEGAYTKELHCLA